MEKNEVEVPPPHVFRCETQNAIVDFSGCNWNTHIMIIPFFAGRKIPDQGNRSKLTCPVHNGPHYAYLIGIDLKV